MCLSWQFLVKNLDRNPWLVSGSCASLWRPGYHGALINCTTGRRGMNCCINRGVIGLYCADCRPGKLLDLFGRIVRQHSWLLFFLQVPKVSVTLCIINWLLYGFCGHCTFSHIIEFIHLFIIVGNEVSLSPVGWQYTRLEIWSITLQHELLLLSFALSFA